MTLEVGCNKKQESVMDRVVADAHRLRETVTNVAARLESVAAKYGVAAPSSEDKLARAPDQVPEGKAHAVLNELASCHEIAFRCSAALDRLNEIL